MGMTPEELDALCKPPKTAVEEFFDRFRENPNDPPQEIRIYGYRYTLKDTDGS